MNQHNLSNHSCDIDGATAYCETYVVGMFLSCTMASPVPCASGRYMDQLEKRDGEWQHPMASALDR